MWKRLRSRLSRGGPSNSPWTDVNSITHLSVDGRVHPLHREFATFTTAAADENFALLTSNFSVFNAGMATPPYFELAQALGRGSEVMEQSALHCLHCFIRHSVNALAIRSMVQNKPIIKACQQCGCPEAVMIYDRNLAARNGAPHVLQRTDGAGRRIEHIYLWHESDSAPAPEALHSTIDHISQGADTEGCRITASPAPPGHEDLRGLAEALVFHHEQEGVLSRDALSRMETMEVYVPDCGPVFMAVVTAPDRAG